MNGLVYSASLMAAFLGGILALFAPCCIVTLLPNFVGASVRRGIRALPMTALLFSSGLAVILLPIVLGIGAIGHVIGRYHTVVFVSVGTFLVLLGTYILTGKRWSIPLPMMSWLPGRSTNAGTSTFFLGVASGVASSCCAPVMAGVVAMSALSGSWVGALGLGLAYIFGMVFPLLLFAIAAVRHGERRQAPARRVHVLGNDLVWTDALSGSMFVVFGAVTVLLGFSGEASITPGPLAAWDRWVTGWAADVAVALGKLPLIVQACLLAGLAAAVVVPLRRAIRRSDRLIPRHEPPTDDESFLGDERDPVCGMVVGPKSLSYNWEDVTYRFCAAACRDRFAEAPEEYVPLAAIPRRG